MARFNSGCKLMACMVLAMLVVLVPSAEAVVGCGQVYGAVGKCLPYLRSQSPDASGCCAGVRSLNAAVKTMADRKAVCGCIRSIAGRTSGVNWKLAGSLPSKCGVSIPYTISPSTDCSRSVNINDLLLLITLSNYPFPHINHTSF